MMEKQKKEENSTNVFICIAEGEKMRPLFQISLSKAAIKSGSRQIACKQTSGELPAEPPCDAFYLWNNSRLFRVETESILYVKADRCYCEIHLTDGRKFVLSLPMSGVAALLPADRFICVHRSFVVNRKMIAVIEGNRIFLPDGEELPLGRQHHKSLMQSLKIINTQNKKYCPVDSSDIENADGTNH
jgi:DNA-binding LytR/AlgR family response regulator